MTYSASNRRLRGWRDHLAYAGLGMALGVAGMLAIGRVAPLWLGLSATAIMAGAGLTACLKGGRVDEVALAGVKFAWLWGGFFGLTAAMGLGVWAGASGLGLAWPQLPAEQRAFAAGIAITIAAQFAGHLLVLAGWWWRAGRD